MSAGVFTQPFRIPMDPASLVGMASEFGAIHEDLQKGRKPRWRIYLGKKGGKVIYMTGMPNPVDPRKPFRFISREQAETMQESIRGAIKAGIERESIVASCIPEEYSRVLIETLCEQYLTRYQSLVDSGERSPTSLREIRRWAKKDGHWGYWWHRDARSLTNGDASEWHLWLAERKISPKTRRNVSDGFRRMLNWASANDAQGAGKAWPVPLFPSVAVEPPATATIPIERVMNVLGLIPWERRGIYLAIAFESVRFGTAVCHTLDDYDPGTHEIYWHRARKGQRLDAPVRGQKNRARIRRVPWAPELVRWLEWRIAQATDEERLAGEAQALFWDPKAYNQDKVWNYTSYRRCWNTACKKAGEDIAPQAGTRHSVLSRLAEVLTPDALKSQSQHRSLQSLSHYTVGARPNHAAMVRAMKEKRK